MARLTRTGAATVGQALTRLDAWANEVLGMGGERDPSVYTTFGSRPPLTDATLEALFVEEHFAARVVELLPRYGLRKGWDLSVPGDPAAAAKLRGAFEVQEEELDLDCHLMDGAVLGRLFGGAITWIGADDGNAPDMPLDERAIESVRWLHTFDRREVQVHTRYQDATHPKFQQPETFKITPRVPGAMLSGTVVAGGTIVHESRCIVWPGQKTTLERKLGVLAGWDDSVLERCWDALRQVGEDYAGKSLVLARIGQFVFKIKKLGELIAGNETLFRKRMTLLDRGRSRNKAIVLDLEESAENVTQPVSGVDVLVDKAVERVAIAADVPLTIFAGRASQGSNADTELEAWFATVEAWQREVALPRHTRIARLMLLAKDGPSGGEEPSEWAVHYRPLRTPTPKEAAELRKLEAEADAIEIDKGIIPPEAAALARHTLTGTGRVLLDTAEVEAALARRRELAKQPPKDNAQLGTVGARDAALGELQAAFYAGRIPLDAALARLELVFLFSPEDARRLLVKPAGWEPPAEAPPSKPGPAPGPMLGEGAGAPQGLPGLNSGGARDPGEQRVQHGQGNTGSGG